jgi:hypothetical protein
VREQHHRGELCVGVSTVTLPVAAGVGQQRAVLDLLARLFGSSPRVYVVCSGVDVCSPCCCYGLVCMHACIAPGDAMDARGQRRQAGLWCDGVPGEGPKGVPVGVWVWWDGCLVRGRGGRA